MANNSSGNLKERWNWTRQCYELEFQRFLIVILIHILPYGLALCFSLAFNCMKNSFCSPWWQRGWLLIHLLGNSLGLPIHIWVALEQGNRTKPKSLDLISSKLAIKILKFIGLCNEFILLFNNLKILQLPGVFYLYFQWHAILLCVTLNPLWTKSRMAPYELAPNWFSYWFQIENGYFMWRTFYSIPLCQGCYLQLSKLYTGQLHRHRRGYTMLQPYKQFIKLKWFY